MPLFKYTGEKREMPNCYGYDFSNWEIVEVTDDFSIKKFTNNSHFKLITDDPDINCDFGVFRVKEDGKNYSKPDKVFEKKEGAERYLEQMNIDGKERTILKRTKA